MITSTITIYPLYDQGRCLGIGLNTTDNELNFEPIISVKGKTMYQRTVTITYDLPDNKSYHIQLEDGTDILVKIVEGTYWVEVSSNKGWEPLGEYTHQQLVDLLLPVILNGTLKV